MLLRWRFFIVVIFVIFLFGVGYGGVRAQFAGGVGTSESPYEITDCTQLQEVGTSLSSYFILTQNIDCSETSTWNLDTGSTYFGFSPVGTFSGNFNGQNYVISDLYINRPTDSYVGLFGSVGGWGVVTGVGLTNVRVSGNEYVGGLVGYVYSSGLVHDVSVSGDVYGFGEVGGVAGIFEIFENGGTVSNLSFDGNVRGNGMTTSQMWNVGGVIGGIWANTAYDTTVFSGLSSHGTVSAGTSMSDVGGLVGYTPNRTSIVDSFSSSVVTGEDYVAGLVGENRSAISDSYFMGSVSATDDYIGGLVGFNYGKSVTNSYSMGTIEGRSYVGGLVGENDDGPIDGCYSTGGVIGTGDIVGGLVGGNILDTNAPIITKSYATGTVNGGNAVGGLVGFNEFGHIENTYARGNVTGTGYCVGGMVGQTKGYENELNSVVNSYSTGDVRGYAGIGGFVGCNDRDVITNSFSVGQVSAVGSTMGGFMGILLFKKEAENPSDTVSTFLINDGWYSNYSGAPSSAVGYVYYVDGGGSMVSVGETNVTYSETDSTVFYSSAHSIYNVGSTVWDFSTPIWYEWTDDYPLFTPQPASPTATPTLTPTPTSSGGSSDGGSSTSCNDAAPLTAPDLFQINAGKNSATLFYTPTTSKTTSYAIMYGYSEGDERFGVIAPILNNNEGVQDFTIRDLEVGKTYFFKVAAKNGCNIGPWSAWKAVKIVSGTTSISKSSTATGSGELPQTGATLPTVALGLTSLLSLGGSWWLFRK